MSRDETTRARLDRLTSEARTELVPRSVDWARVERTMEARLDDGAGRFVSRAPRAPRALAVVGAVALAAAVALLVTRRPVPAGDVHAVTAPSPVASGEGPREPFDATATRARFVRDGTATWIAEPGSRGTIGRAGGAVVVALDTGVVEAHVTRSPLPESFAVDVGEGTDVVRVAVHGTHLRVAREGRRVIVDLSEGVVAIGRPPREGLTVGTTVRAPAHVELDVHELASLTVDARPDAVRPPLSLDEEGVTPPSPGAPLAAAAPSHPAPHAASAPRVAPATPGAVSLDVIAGAVAACAASVERPGVARVTGSSVLHLVVDDTGRATSARFDPPLSPSVQECAAREIYRRKIDGRGEVSVPVAFTY